MRRGGRHENNIDRDTRVLEMCKSLNRVCFRMDGWMDGLMDVSSRFHQRRPTTERRLRQHDTVDTVQDTVVGDGLEVTFLRLMPVGGSFRRVVDARS